MMDWLQEHLLGAGLGVLALAVPFLIPRARKAVGAAVARALGKELKASINLHSGDPKLEEKWRKWFLATVELAEYAIPDRGKGAERKAWVKSQAERAFPGIIAELIAQSIEEAWESSDDVLKGTLKDNEPPPTPTQPPISPSTHSGPV